MASHRCGLLVSVAIVVLVIALIICAFLLRDRLTHPRYFGIQHGMTRADVDALIGAGHDDYGPNCYGGSDSYYGSSEGTILVQFDAEKRVVRKNLQRD
jgi:hypothetical protein